MHDDVVKYLLRGKPPKNEVCVQNEDLYSALHFAAWNDDGGMIEMLLDAGADISAKDKNGLTPLHWAARQGNIKAIDVLLVSGADGSIYDKQGWRPMDLAEIHGQIAAMNILPYPQMNRLELRSVTLPVIATPGSPGQTSMPPPATTIGRLLFPARPPPNRDNGTAQSHVGEPPKDVLRHVRVKGKVL
jgi:hypothetical protein